MKKTISILLILSTFLFVLSGCFDTNLNKNTEKNPIAGYDFVKNSSGKNYFENYCRNCNIEIIEPTIMADSYNYENGNEITSIQVNSNKNTDEIYYIKVMALKEINIDDFLKACELGFQHDNVAKEWIKNGIQQEKTNYFDGMHYKLTQPLNKPILEIFTPNGQRYEKEQEKKSLDFDI